MILSLSRLCLFFSGVYHGFKERLKPKIQRVARARYGARGQVSDPLASPIRPAPVLVVLTPLTASFDCILSLQALGLTAPRGRGHDAVPDAEPHPSAGERAAAASTASAAVAAGGGADAPLTREELDRFAFPSHCVRPCLVIPTFIDPA